MTVQSPQLVCTVKQNGEIFGFLVIDSFVQGRSHGGIRVREDLTEEEIRLLARTMTRKYRFLNLPFGGAKAGIIGDPEASAQARLDHLITFGQAIKPLLESELFVPAGDMGTSLSEIRVVLRKLGIRFERRRLPDVSSGKYTAHSVFTGFRELARFRGMDLAGLTVAIDGFGDVGSHLALQLEQAGIRVLAVSTSRGAIYDRNGLDIHRLLELRERHGSGLVEHYDAAERIPDQEMYGLPVDLLSPCSTIHRIDQFNIGAIKAVIICPGANNPWEAGTEIEFDRRGISYLPDFAANNGGVLGTTMAYAGFKHDQIADFIRTEIGALQRVLLERAKTDGISIQRAAEAIVRIRVSSAGNRQRRAPSGFVQLGLNLHRRGWVPAALVRPFARRYLQRRIRAGLGY
jgi:glutamate dehydrogenase (NAD(P)+)